MDKNNRREARFAENAADTTAEEFIGIGEFGESPELPARAGRPGSFAGRGSRLYRRPDEMIIDDICERLARHPSIDASNIEVLSRFGQVTLEGFVDAGDEKRWAEEIAV